MSTSTVVLALVAAAFAAANAGAFYAFSSFVMPALARIPSAQGAAAMQSINITAVRPPFMLLFIGAAPLSLAVGVVGVLALDEPYGPWFVAGALLHLIGCFGLTIAFHVPRNDALAPLDPDAPTSEAAWRSYLTQWTAGNHVRTAAAMLAAAAMVIGLQVD